MSEMYTKTAPESSGIRSRVIIEAIQKLNAEGVPMHSFLVLRKKNIVAEIYWKPWNRNSLHRMYSVTKSFVSLAIGFLADEGKIQRAKRGLYQGECQRYPRGQWQCYHH